MPEKPQKEMIRELYQAVIGINGNPDENGLIGDVRDINKKLDIVNGRTRKNEIRSKVNQALLAVILGGASITAGIAKVFHLW